MTEVKVSKHQQRFGNESQCSEYQLDVYTPSAATVSRDERIVAVKSFRVGDRVSILNTGECGTVVELTEFRDNPIVLVERDNFEGREFNPPKDYRPSDLVKVKIESESFHKSQPTTNTYTETNHKHAKDNYLALDLIATDGGTQSRAGLDERTIDEYAEAMDAGSEFPPVTVFYDGEEYWLADGFHRVAAAHMLEWTDIRVSVRQGTRRDAVLHSVGANTTHGLRRTNADKRRAVETLLRDGEWSQWSDREIARRTQTSAPFVAKLRASVNVYRCSNSADEKTAPKGKRTVERDGTVYTQNTANIGKKRRSESDNNNVVERLKQKETTPPPIPHKEGDVVMIRGLGHPDLRKFDGRWAIALQINEYTVAVALGGKDCSVKPQFLEPVDPKYWAEIKAVNERITRLQQYDLDPMEDAGLEVLRRRTCFTPKQMTLLKFLEQQYGIK